MDIPGIGVDLLVLKHDQIFYSTAEIIPTILFNALMLNSQSSDGTCEA